MHTVDNTPLLEMLGDFFLRQVDVKLALLVGSRVKGSETVNSDWDFSIQWKRDIPYMDTLGKTEVLRSELAGLLKCSCDKIDIIDMPSAHLAMRATIAEEGVLLKGDNQLAWSHFLLRTWRDLEDFEWEQKHAI